MKVLISFINHKSEPQDPKRLVGIFDLQKKKIIKWLNLSICGNYNDIVHATGMCYQNDYLYIGLIPSRYRLTGKIFSINIKSGACQLNELRLTKGIHGICSYHDNIILANSCQNDLITAITFKDGGLICEDIFFDFLENQNSGMRSSNKYDFTDWPDSDDNYHNNSINIDSNGDIWISSFFSYLEYPWKIERRENKIDINKNSLLGKPKGIVANISKNPPLIHAGYKMPHTVYFDYKGDLLYCESKTFRVWHSRYGACYCDGYTRGICEDKVNHGYWVGLSAYRQRLRDGSEKILGDLKGAKVVFVDYNMEKRIGWEWDMSEFGLEIFDIIPFQSGEYK